MCVFPTPFVIRRKEAGVAYISALCPFPFKANSSQIAGSEIEAKAVANAGPSPLGRVAQ